MMPTNPRDIAGINDGVGSNKPNGHQVPAYIGIAGAYADPAGRDSPSATVSFYCNSSNNGYITNTGMLLLGEKIRSKDCTDGLSRTYIVCEQSGDVGGNDWRLRYNSPWGSGSGTDGNPESVSQLIAKAFTGSVYGSSIVTVRYAINTSTVNSAANNTTGWNSILNSDHMGGINGLLADGAVRFVPNNIDFTMFKDLCVRNDGLTGGRVE
jgi:hypothetical protein